VRIRRRLVLLAVAVATAGMTLFAVLLSGLLARGVATDQDVVLARLAAGTAAVVEAVGPEGLASRQPLAPVDLATSTDPFVVVLDADGRPLYSTAAASPEAAPRVPAAVVVEAIETGSSVATIGQPPEMEFRVAASRWTSAGESGIAVAAQSARFVEQQIAGVRFFLIFAAIVTIIAVALVSWFVIGRALRPLRTLTATADEIARTGDLSRRLPDVRTRDEVGVLTASFNGMLERVSAAQDELGASLAAQRRFVADASHELRTPLTTIRNNAGFLAEHPDAVATDRAEALADIEAESERLSRLVDDLLRLARADAGGRLERAPVDLRAIVEDVARKARRPDRNVIVAAWGGAAVVDGDGDALTRLAWILVDNALRHGSGDVEVAVRAEGGSVALTVADRGPGIPPGNETRIFERFHRADPARSGGGAGLGLAIATTIVDAHGGTIEAANREGGGAVFRVTLPALGG
jgi:two-component system OmpR family sensor kinase